MAVNPVVFLKEVRLELGHVTWPTSAQVVRLTGLVIAISVVVGLLLGTIDFVFFKIMEVLL